MKVKNRHNNKKTIEVERTEISRCEESQLAGTQAPQSDDRAPQKGLVGQV